MCHIHLDLIKQVCAQLGFPLKWEKVEGPACVIEFLGIVLDTSLMEVRLQSEKASELQGLVDQWSHRRACRKREMLSLIGKLVNALPSKDTLIMHLLRRLYYYVALHNIYIKAEHVPGVLNSVADS